MQGSGPVVGFDLDMTLIDSRPGVAATLRAITAETGVPIDADLVVSRLGPRLEDEMALWFPEAEVAPVSDRYRELYAALGVPGSELLPGAAEAVTAVRAAGGRSVVVTAKHGPNADLCLAHVGLAVDAVVGSRHGPGKADALVEHGAVAYVGDTPPDMVAARAAGVVAVGVTTGPHDRDTLLGAGADVVLDSLRRFPAWFAAWRRGDGVGAA
ncbi:MAG TPA: HAD hydrolase-like protein [Acidimicrobiia bacterium]|nr:HAD hydrolase-like protein [Acidimicrobiia bacterium]